MRGAALLALLVPCALAACGGGGAPAAADRPNVVVVLADDLGFGDLGCTGHPRGDTPHVDRLAAEGTLFTQFYANSPTCTPSRVALFTGRYPQRHRLDSPSGRPERNAERGMADFLDPAAPNLARTFRAAGYATAHLGKWHLGAPRESPPASEYGFDLALTDDDWEGGLDLWAPAHRAGSSSALVERTLEFAAAQAGRPFFAQVWLLDPHMPLFPTEADLARASDLAPVDGVRWPGAEQLYRTAVVAADDAVGRLLEGLEALGIADDTIVVFASDNGPESPDVQHARSGAAGRTGPFRGCKRSLYEGGVRVPLVVRWPGRVPAGRVADATVEAGFDLLPTLAALCGVAAPDGLDGEDRADVWLGGARPRREPLRFWYRFPVFGDPVHQSPALAIRSGRWKLLENPDRSRVELYDLAADPWELANRAESEPERVAALRAELDAWRAGVPDLPFPRSAGTLSATWPEGER